MLLTLLKWKSILQRTLKIAEEAVWTVKEETVFKLFMRILLRRFKWLRNLTNQIMCLRIENERDQIIKLSN